MAIGWLTALDLDGDAYWPSESSGDLTDAERARLLEAARVQCEAYAPTLAVDAVVPETHRLAQAYQARALYRSGQAGSRDQIGGDGLAVTVFPMDWTVKNLLRPRRIGRVL